MKCLHQEQKQTFDMIRVKIIVHIFKAYLIT